MRFLLLLSLFSLLSCINRSKDPRTVILEKFDSIDKKLDQLISNSNNDNVVALYDSVNKKFGEDYLREFILTTNDAKSFLLDLKSRFAWFCGDSTGNLVPSSGENLVELTNKFFFEKQTLEIFFAQMSSVQETLLGASKDPILDQRIINSLGNPSESSAKEYMRKYFYNVPPVAATTIISKFENDILTLEREVLRDLLKKHNVPSN